MDIGVDLDKPIIYSTASFRFFSKGEYHITRHCNCDVLLLVFDGVLRFTEDGVPCEVRAGEYYIQRQGGFQSADRASEEPRYLYVHFIGEWTDGAYALNRRGAFSVNKLYPFMERLDRAAHNGGSYTERSALLLTMLTVLHSQHKTNTLADEIADFIFENMRVLEGLGEICEKFCYSKNHIINIFKAEYGMTPVEYLGQVRIKQAMYLAEVTSMPLGDICEEVGFNNYSHFYRLFTRKNGMSPESWRAAVRAKAGGQGI